jgi:hypothetical protein
MNSVTVKRPFAAGVLADLQDAQHVRVRKRGHHAGDFREELAELVVFREVGKHPTQENLVDLAVFAGDSREIDLGDRARTDFSDERVFPGDGGCSLHGQRRRLHHERPLLAG